MAVRFLEIEKSYSKGVVALGPLSLEIPMGQLVAIIGPSGSGKSTFLKLINGLISSTSGVVTTLGISLKDIKDKDLRKLRLEVAFVFQDLGVLPRLTALETVLTGSLGRLRFPRVGVRSYPKKLRAEANALLSKVGLGDFADQRVGQLSGGQIQRVAIARALFQKPKILILDEPISSLDPETSRVILDLVSTLASESKLTVIASLHQVEWAQKWPDRVIGLKAGKVIIDDQANNLKIEKLKKFYE